MKTKNKNKKHTKYRAYSQEKSGKSKNKLQSNDLGCVVIERNIFPKKIRLIIDWIDRLFF